jgi:hypothetical protein
MGQRFDDNLDLIEIRVSGSYLHFEFTLCAMYVMLGCGFICARAGDLCSTFCLRVAKEREREREMRLFLGFVLAMLRAF